MRILQAALFSMGLMGIGLPVSEAADYVPPAASAALLKGIDFKKAVPVDEAYRAEFANCDKNNKFRGVDLTGDYRCKKMNAAGKDISDPNRAEALLRLANGAIYWHSKMALDVDGSWAAWNGLGDHTTQKRTSFHWSDQADPKSQAAQADPDQFPFIVIPTDGIKAMTHERAKELGAEFADKTGLAIGDLGVVIYKGTWTPAFVADGGPFMRLGEASSLVFKLVGQDRCRKWSEDKKHCVGPGNNAEPYRDFSVGKDVIFIVFPKSGVANMTAGNAIATICQHAKDKLFPRVRP
jgi:hypothetical protein